MGDVAGPGLRLETIRRYGPPPAALALAGDRIAVGDAAGRVEVAGATWPGLGAGQGISLAPSGTAVLLRSAAGDSLELRDARDGRTTARLTAHPAGVPLATGTILDTPDGELLIASTERMRLRVLDVRSGTERLNVLVDRPRGFEYRAFVRTGDRDTVIAVGHYASEMKDSLVALSLHGLLTDPDHLGRTLARPAVTDYAYTVAAGPGVDGEAVCYRDPEDDEDEEPADDPDPHRLDVYGLHGYYVRRLADRVLVGRPSGGAAPVQDLLTATARHILAAVAGGVQVIPRDGGTPTLVPAAVVALDPAGGRCVLGDAGTGDLRLLTVS